MITHHIQKINSRDLVFLSDDVTYKMIDGQLHFIWIDQSTNGDGILVNPAIPLVSIAAQSISLEPTEGNYILTDDGIQKMTVTQAFSSIIPAKANLTAYAIGQISSIDLIGNQNLQLTIYNMSGQQVMFKESIGPNDLRNMDFNLFQSGIYIIKLKNEDNNRSLKVFIAQ